MLKLGLKSRAVKLMLIALGFSIAGAVVAQTRDEMIAERIAPVGQVCLLGEECAQGQAAASNGGAAAGGAAAGGEFDVAATFDQNCAMCTTQAWQAPLVVMIRLIGKRVWPMLVLTPW